ncbi:hypothetical protein JNJ66_07835, partial [Candidatus Saccharibacteria bacterium]|nr:hypothetical protein [Candidatus Saccharibacteria bacterium]
MKRTVLLAMAGLLVFTAAEPNSLLALDVLNLFDKKDSGVIDTSGVAAMEQVEAKQQPATDSDVSGGDLGGILDATPAALDPTQEPEGGELTSERTAFSTTYDNGDGTRRLVVSEEQKNFIDPTDKKFKPIDDKALGDTAYASKKPIEPVTGIVGKDTPKLTDPQAYKIKAGNTAIHFRPFADGTEVKIGGKTLTLKPVGAKNVKPFARTDRNGVQLVTYKNAWPGVDVEYETRGESLKENIIIHKENLTNNFKFTVEGASLLPHPSVEGAFAIEGLDPAHFMFSPLSMLVNKKGITSEKAVSQSFNNGTLTVQMDQAWYAARQAEDFPLVIDPSVTTNIVNNFNDYWSVKSDGYVCGSTTCFPNVGQIDDNGWKSWRSILNLPFTQAHGKTILAANLYLPMTDRAYYWGSTATRDFWVKAAECIGFNCGRAGSAESFGTVGTYGNINVFDTVNWMKNNNLTHEKLYVRGEEGAYESYKALEPNDIQLTVVYTTPPPMATPMAQGPENPSPANNGTVVDVQPTLRVNQLAANDADGQQIRYKFTVSSTGGGGIVAASDWSTASTWTVPDDILQDGSTYYWNVATYDGDVVTSPDWTHSFKVDFRTGKDSTQAYDTVGPASIDLATGNLATSTSTHSMSALGGSLGVSLDYNSPQRSRNGLVGEFWNINPTDPGVIPTTTPAMTGVYGTIDQNWNAGSPAGLQNDGFVARWTGYFTAPSTGTFIFGGDHDDNLRVYVNNQNVYTSTICSGASCFGSGVSLTAGQTVPFRVEYKEGAGNAFVKLKVKGAVTERVVPREWLQTGVRAVAQSTGLVGHYYDDYDNDRLFPSDDSGKFLTRTDKIVSFDWTGTSPIPGGKTDNFLVRWVGYFTAPVAGNYTFGTYTDDGARLWVNNSASPVVDKWVSQPSVMNWATSSITLTAGQSIPIKMEYYEATGAAMAQLKVKGAVPEQTVQSAWLSPKAHVLSDGWNLSADPDGDLGYDRMRVNSNNAVLTDSTGQTHEYTWKDGGYKPPVNEDGHLARNGDGTHTLIDDDGRTYIFNVDGTLRSSTTMLDDRKPAAVRYEYASVSSGPARLIKIVDGVTDQRYATLHYSGDTQCNATTPWGFDGQAPANMLCAVKTSDGDLTRIWYVQGRVARLEKPGGEIEDFQYDSLGRIIAFRDSIANDALAAGIRTNDPSAKTEVTYDALGRVATITQPAAVANGNRMGHTFEYRVGSTLKHINNAPEPNGFSQKVDYDSTFRTTASTDVSNLTTTTEWDPIKDLVLSSTDPTGLKATTIYDDSDRPVDSYGPAPAAWFGTDRKPLTAYNSQVPHTQTGYDEGITGPAVSFMDYGPNSKTLTNAPKLNATGLTNNGANPGQVSQLFNLTPPVSTLNSANWGMRATGKMRLPQTGNYQIRIYSDDGVRMWIDDKLVIDDWNNGAGRYHTAYTLNNTANALKRIRIDYYHVGATETADFSLQIAPPGSNTFSKEVAQYITPAYNLTTSQKAFDAQLGDSVSTTEYAKPEYGLATKSTLDATGLNYQTTSQFEAPNSGFLRQTSKTLPGGTVTTYQHYGATETADNPCTTNVVETFRQAGRLKGKVETDPDGSGPKTSRTSQTIYNEGGDIVATRFNNDNWTCTTYDTRGRVTVTIVPARGSAAGRTITNNWALNGNPLHVTSGDDEGTIQTNTDLLGRTTYYKDVQANEATSTYDALGRLTQRTGTLGTETFVYDDYDKLIEQKVDNVTIAVPHYDSFGRLSSVDYPTAGQMKLNAIVRDDLGRTTGQNYVLGDGTTTVSDSVTRSQSGQITGGTEHGQSKSYSYDKAGRLTAATIGAHSYTYGFDAPTNCWGSYNPNAHKNSNRTSMSHTFNGTTSTTTYCYDFADRLIYSDDKDLEVPVYDDHGNTTRLGSTWNGGTDVTEFFYDASDRNQEIRQNWGEKAISYDRDVQNRITMRWMQENGVNTDAQWYGFTTPGDA